MRPNLFKGCKRAADTTGASITIAAIIAALRFGLSRAKREAVAPRSAVQRQAANPARVTPPL